MKPTLINNGLEPPEHPNMHELSFEDELQQWKEYAKIHLQPEDIFDLYNHDIKVSFPFAEYLSYHYVTVRTEEGFRHKARGEWYTTEQIWEEYCKQ